MRIVFLGSGAFGVPTLTTLLAEHEVAAVVTQPDRPAGRGGKLTPTPVSDAIAALGADAKPPLLKPESINAPGPREQLRALDADAWVVIAYGQKLGQDLLEDVFAINLHASPLPRWRGAAPIHHAVLAGEKETGNSVITLADRMDAGAVLGRSRRPIEPTHTTGELHDLLAADGPPVVQEVLTRHASGTLAPEVQDESRVTLAPKLSRAAAALDLSETCERVRCLVNGLSPWPGVGAALGGEGLKLLRAGPVTGSLPEARPGTIVDAEAGLVMCGEGAIRLIEVQPAGKRPMAWEAFARGRGIESGSMLLPKNQS
ncbi:MAG: methionyl-tRNA formyltransferase [Planctomycetota bacterium]